MEARTEKKEKKKENTVRASLQQFEKEHQSLIKRRRLIWLADQSLELSTKRAEGAMRRGMAVLFVRETGPTRTSSDNLQPAAVRLVKGAVSILLGRGLRSWS